MSPENAERIIKLHIGIIDVFKREQNFQGILEYAELAKSILSTHPNQALLNRIVYEESEAYLLLDRIEDAVNAIHLLKQQGHVYPRVLAGQKIDSLARNTLQEETLTEQQKTTILDWVVTLARDVLEDNYLYQRYQAIQSSRLAAALVAQLNSAAVSSDELRGFITEQYDKIIKISKEHLQRIEPKIKLFFLRYMLAKHNPLTFHYQFFNALIESSIIENPYHAYHMLAKYHLYRAEYLDVMRALKHAYEASSQLKDRVMTSYEYAKALAKEGDFSKALIIIRSNLVEINKAVDSSEYLSEMRLLNEYKGYLSVLENRYQAFYSQPRDAQSQRRRYSSAITGALVIDLDNTLFYFQNGKDGFNDLERSVRFSFSDKQLESFYTGSFDAWMTLLEEAKLKGIKVIPLTARQAHPIGDRENRGHCPLLDHFMTCALQRGILRTGDLIFTNGQDKANFLKGIAVKLAIPNNQVIFLDDQSALIESARRSGFLNAIQACDLSNESTYAFQQMVEVVRRKMNGIYSKVSTIRNNESNREVERSYPYYQSSMASQASRRPMFRTAPPPIHRNEPESEQRFISSVAVPSAKRSRR